LKQMRNFYESEKIKLEQRIEEERAKGSKIANN
jgi:hypothetical protein